VSAQAALHSAVVEQTHNARWLRQRYSHSMTKVMLAGHKQGQESLTGSIQLSNTDIREQAHS
jgi:hypothetical protein